MLLMNLVIEMNMYFDIIYLNDEKGLKYKFGTRELSAVEAAEWAADYLISHRCVPSGGIIER